MTEEVPKEDTLGHLMSSPVTTVNSDDTLTVAAETMVKHGIGAVVVLEVRNPAGIVTERDITDH